MALLFTSTSFATSNDLQRKQQYSKDINSMSVQELNTLNKEIHELSDKEFNQFLVKYFKNNTDYIKVENELAKLDVEVTVPKLTTSIISPMYTEAYNSNLWVTSAKRGVESYHRLIAYYGFDKGYAEWNPATYDVIGVYWNKKSSTTLSVFSEHKTLVLSIVNQLEDINTSVKNQNEEELQKYKAKLLELGNDIQKLINLM